MEHMRLLGMPPKRLKTAEDVVKAVESDVSTSSHCFSIRCTLGDIRLWVGDPSSRRVKGFRHLLVVCPTLSPSLVFHAGRPVQI